MLPQTQSNTQPKVTKTDLYAALRNPGLFSGCKGGQSGARCGLAHVGFSSRCQSARAIGDIKESRCGIV